MSVQDLETMLNTAQTLRKPEGVPSVPMDQMLCMLPKEEDANTVASDCTKKSRARSRGRSKQSRAMLLSLLELNGENTKGAVHAHHQKPIKRSRSLSKRQVAHIKAYLSFAHKQADVDMWNVLGACRRQARTRSRGLSEQNQNKDNSFVGDTIHIKVANARKAFDHDTAQSGAQQQRQQPSTPSGKGLASQMKISL